MRPLIHLLQPLNGGVGINLRRRDRSVTEEFLHGSKVRPRIEQVRRERVAQRVGRQAGIFIKRVCPSASLTVVAGTGHAVNLEEPDLFNGITAEFLAQVDSGRWKGRDPRSLGKSTMAKK